MHNMHSTTTIKSSDLSHLSQLASKNPYRYRADPYYRQLASKNPYRYSAAYGMLRGGIIMLTVSLQHGTPEELAQAVRELIAESDAIQIELMKCESDPSDSQPQTPKEKE